MLFGCYRRGEANDPDAYVLAIAAVLSRYEPDLVREVTDPNTGIQTTEKYMTFMPNAGELKVYCEGQAARRERIKRLGSLPKPDFSQARLAPPARPAHDPADTFVGFNHPNYARVYEWSKTADPSLWRPARMADSTFGPEGMFVKLSALEDLGVARRTSFRDQMVGASASKVAADVTSEAAE